MEQYNNFTGVMDVGNSLGTKMNSKNNRMNGKNKLKLSSICLLFAALLFTGCDQDDIISPDDNAEDWPVGQNVFVAGYENNAQGNSAARLWKNGVVQNLAGSVFRSSNTDGTLEYAEARSVFISGNDVYVAGYEQFQKEIQVTENVVNYETIRRARLWKNGVLQHLTNGISFDEATSVFVSDNNVYVLGREVLENPRRFAFKLWKNGEAEIFAEGNNEWQANSLFVSDGDVYIAGRERNTDGFHAILWKNGVGKFLDSGTANSSRANSVFASGSDVYVAGSGGSFAKLWKNGKAENLTDGTANAEANSVYVSGGNVFVAGFDGIGTAKLWKNSNEQDMPDAKDAELFQSVFVSGDDVYLAGYVEAIEEIPSSVSIGYFKATLWRNGKKLNLDVGRNNSWAISIYVQ